MNHKYSQKYTVVCIFEKEPKTDFPASRWPLHVTMLDTFKTHWELSELGDKLGNLALATKPFETSAIGSALLGEDRNVPVKLLRLDGSLFSLHKDLMSLANEGDFIFNTPEFVGDGFLPHATDQDDGKVEIGQSYLLENMSLVDMFPNDDPMQRRIVDIFDFKN